MARVRRSEAAFRIQCRSHVGLDRRGRDHQRGCADGLRPREDGGRRIGVKLRPGFRREREAPSALRYGTLATWRSGYAAACKAVYTGSIPVVALILPAKAQQLQRQ